MTDLVDDYFKDDDVQYNEFEESVIYKNQYGEKLDDRNPEKSAEDLDHIDDGNLYAKPYKCNICETRTETVESMKDHIKIEHEQYLFYYRNQQEVP